MYFSDLARDAGRNRIIPVLPVRWGQDTPRLRVFQDYDSKTSRITVPLAVSVEAVAEDSLA